MVVLNRGILVALIREEEDTAKRYEALAVEYNIPELRKASREEAGHAKMFKKILNNWRND